MATTENLEIHIVRVEGLAIRQADPYVVVRVSSLAATSTRAPQPTTSPLPAPPTGRRHRRSQRTTAVPAPSPLPPTLRSAASRLRLSTFRMTARGMRCSSCRTLTRPPYRRSRSWCSIATRPPTGTKAIRPPCPQRHRHRHHHIYDRHRHHHVYHRHCQVRERPAAGHHGAAAAGSGRAGADLCTEHRGRRASAHHGRLEASARTIRLAAAQRGRPAVAAAWCAGADGGADGRRGLPAGNGPHPRRLRLPGRNHHYVPPLPPPPPLQTTPHHHHRHH